MSLMMKKKKHVGLQIVQCLLLRRRLHSLFPMFSAVFACLLLLFTALSFLSPPHPTLNTSFNKRNKFHMNIKKENVFRVPLSGGKLSLDLWTSNRSDFFYGCSNASLRFRPAEIKTEHDRYLLIETSGGLNQQRTGIIDAVVAAYILNATLVVPKLDQKSFWNDSSNFSEIFDVEWFIKYLSADVKIIKEIPPNAGKIVTTRAPRKCNQQCYQARILPIFSKKHVQGVQLGKFDYRLSNGLDIDLLKLRCRVNYHALRFTDPIVEMGQKLVERMRRKSKNFVALHLRFEPDMLAFSGCYYGGGEKELKELGAIRKRWKTLPEKNPDRERRHGKCPLTPEEVGLMLRALGFGNDAHIYVASGEVHGGEETLAPLKALFPNIHTKESIASKEELAAFSSFSARMAALDFIVCDESDVLVTNNNGNMAKILAGRRRYFGHKPTIRPNGKKLYQLFLNRDSMTWDEFASHLRTFQIGFMGAPNEVKPGGSEFHENPSSCICENSETRVMDNSTIQSGPTINKKKDVYKSSGRYNNGEVSSEDEQESSENEYLV